MSDFNPINPERKPGIQFNANKQGKGAQADANGYEAQETDAGDPYAGLKMDPERMMALLNSQSQLQGQARVEGSRIDSSVNSFGAAISPERHARASRMFEQVYQQEFGRQPAPGLLQTLVDDYLIGQVQIQSA